MLVSLRGFPIKTIPEKKKTSQSGVRSDHSLTNHNPRLTTPPTDLQQEPSSPSHLRTTDHYTPISKSIGTPALQVHRHTCTATTQLHPRGHRQQQPTKTTYVVRNRPSNQPRMGPPDQLGTLRLLRPRKNVPMAAITHTAHRRPGHDAAPQLP